MACQHVADVACVLSLLCLSFLVFTGNIQATLADAIATIVTEVCTILQCDRATLFVVDSEAEQLHTALKQSVKKRKAMDVESAMQVPARPCPSPLSPTQYPR